MEWGPVIDKVKGADFEFEMNRKLDIIDDERIKLWKESSISTLFSIGGKR